ncbi:MAG: NAD(+)--dinitrogen-reductase ADP-D-ribosyltransferase [Rubrivivax sp.]|nr:NAD(+)--dinitrogen-reductase ADP-D-ribosyltransferase [Rubrivivax sp.]
MSAAAASDHPSRWYTTNLVGVPAGVLGSTAFNDHPQALHIAGARECNHGLFALLDRCSQPEQARGVFEHYMAMAFGLTPPESGPREAAAASAEAAARLPAEQRRWRTSYLKLLQGWGLDANGPAGAVLKGWVESRFGLTPSYHAAPLQRFPSEAWTRYLEQKCASRYHNNSIHQQLDLLYEFCQWMLRRFTSLAEALCGRAQATAAGAAQALDRATHAVLYRGSHDCEQQRVSGSLRERRAVIHLNNLVSFTPERETAGCFGDWVMTARVPLVKLLLVPGLLNTASLQGESEVLALGGDYQVELSYGP